MFSSKLTYAIITSANDGDTSSASQLPDGCSNTKATCPAPVVTPAPKVTVITKEVIVAPTQPAAPSFTDSAALPAAATTQPSIATPTPTLAIDGAQASSSNQSPDAMKQAGEAGPYIFFAGLAGLIAMLITARVKKLYPFESGTHRAAK